MSGIGGALMKMTRVMVKVMLARDDTGCVQQRARVAVEVGRSASG